MLPNLFSALQTSLAMILLSASFTLLVGIPLGALKAALGPLGLIQAPFAKRILNTALSITNSIPFIALAILCIPLMQKLGGPQSMLAISIPLCIATIPWIAKGTCDAFANIPKGLITTSSLMGGSPIQIIKHVAIPESLPHLISTIKQALIRLVAYTTLAGFLGAGGLGKLIADHGLIQFDASYVLAVTVTLALLTQSFHSIADLLTASKKPS